jgi:hypothetical protein
LGHVALAAFAMVHAGLSEDGEAAGDRALAKALKVVDRSGRPKGEVAAEKAGTYTTSLLLLLLRDRGRPQDRPRLQALADLLVATQAENGQWSYEGRGPGRRPGAGDNSNAQFAVLALGAAVGEGIDVDRAALERARDWWVRSVQDDGGHGYASGGSLASQSSGSMTAAALCSLAILDAALSVEPRAAARDLALRRLGQDFRVDLNFGPVQGSARERQRNAGRGWVHYWLWSLERAMVLSDQARLAARDWYAEGARHLIDTQHDDGSWRAEHPLYATSFALLFLSRAADPPRAFTPPPRAGGAVTAPGGAPSPAPPPPLAPPGEVADWLREDLAPDGLRDRCLAAGPASLLGLARALGDPDPVVRRRANEALHALVGPERAEPAARHPLGRRRLELWVRKNVRFLVARDGAFVTP